MSAQAALKKEKQMPIYDVKVTVKYVYEVEAESEEEAEKEGWNYENYNHFGEVYSIEIEELDEEY